MRSSWLLRALCLSLGAYLSLSSSGLLNFLSPTVQRATVVSATLLGGAAPALAQQSLEETLNDNSGIFLGLSVVVTIGLLLVPGMFAAMSTTSGKFQVDVPEDFDKNV
mmetsp:Transcript_55781/g.122091  ORF Transcript_55781/g.122091 Transcript_55781/m.122091 type:complete len:108 (+) Transcript_55781:125-448(+)